MFIELSKRRNVRIKHLRYANSITAAAMYNTHRGDSDTPVIHAFDFVREEKDANRLAKLGEAKRFVRQSIGQLPMDTPRAKYLSIRLKTIADLAKNGYLNADEIFDEVWPSLKPTAEELAHE